MLARVTLRVADVDAARGFYATVLGTLGVQGDGVDGTPFGELALVAAGPDQVPTRGLHLGFAAPDVEAIAAFWRAGREAGHPDDGAPGPRPEYGPDYHGGFLRDPDDNSAEAALHDNLRGDALIDHLWIRVADHAASRAFYADLAPRAGYLAVSDRDGLTRFSWGPHQGSFTIVADDAPVTGPFTMALTAAGGVARDTLFDPDGHTVDLV